MVTADHDGPDFTASNHPVEGKGDIHPAPGILVENSGLCPHHQLILPGIPDPVVIVAIFAAAIRIDAGHGGPIGPDQVLRISAEAHPPERTISIVENGPHDILEIRGEYEPVLGVLFVAGDFRNPGIVYRLQKGIAIVKEIDAAIHQNPDELIVAAKAFVHEHTEFFPVACQECRPLLERQPLGAIPAAMGHMTGGLVGQQIDRYVFGHGIFQQIHHVSIIGD